MDQAELQALKIAVKGLVEALAADGVLERERWNALLARFADSIGKLDVDGEPAAASIFQRTAEAVDFYRIEPAID